MAVDAASDDSVNPHLDETFEALSLHYAGDIELRDTP
jgi:hypothetical protein